MFVFRMLMFTLMRLCLCLCASENSIRQISGFVLLMFLLMLTLMSRVFSLVMLMLCLCASENQPLFIQFRIKFCLAEWCYSSFLFQQLFVARGIEFHFNCLLQLYRGTMLFEHKNLVRLFYRKNENCKKIKCRGSID